MSVRGVKQDMGEQSSQDLMTVGELASRVGVTVRTIQYYDQRGLLHPTCKGEQNLRLYSSSDVDRLNRIITLKYLGLSLSQIQEGEGSDPDGELTSALAEREAELERESEDSSGYECVAEFASASCCGRSCGLERICIRRW